MSIKKTFGRLGAIVLLGTIGFTEALGQFIYDYTTTDTYEIKHKGSSVLFKEITRRTEGSPIPRGIDIVIKVTRPNGDISEYVDLKGDKQIDYFNITRNGERKHYSSGKRINRLIMQKAKEQFDFYLKEIEEAKLREVFQN